MKNEDINKGDAVRHIETGMIYKAEYLIEGEKIWAGHEDNEYEADVFFEAADVERVSHNLNVSDKVHYEIPEEVMDIVEGHIITNKQLKCQHNREILDEIIEDLIQYRLTLPTVNDLESVNVL